MFLRFSLQKIVMPRGKPSSCGAAAKKPRGPKAQKLPDSFTAGTTITDLRKKEWVLGREIGQGGFGLIYLANEKGSPALDSNAPFVVKIEPHSNGPLFCELHYYQRVAKSEMVDTWKKEKKMKYLGVPKFVATGAYTRDNVIFRFMVMERFGSDVQKIFEGAGKRFSTHTVYCLALRLIDSLEYMHHHCYVHADIKASNILLGFKGGKQQPDEVYLVDYGLAMKYQIDGVHKAYKEDKRKAHDGTIEFTSTDAHLGVAPSRRGDMEILGFCLLQWLCGCLPWENNLVNKDYVAAEKLKYTKNLPSLMKACFKDGGIPSEIQKYFEMVKKTEYEECPNYEAMRSLFRKSLKSLGVKDEWKLDLPLSGPASPKKAVKRKGERSVASPSPPKRPAAKSAPAVKQKAPVLKKEVLTPSRIIPGFESPRRASSAKKIIPGLGSPRRASSTKKIIPGRPSIPLAATKLKSPAAVNGTTRNGTPGTKAATTKRRVKRRKVVTVDVSMQTSPP